MAALKTLPNNASAEDFIQTIGDEIKKQDSHALLELFKKATKEEPKMWGTSIIGFGQYHYKSERSTQEGDWPLVGFSPRKQNLTLYIMPGFSDMQSYLEKIGKHKTSVACLYINKLADVDLVVLEEIIKKSYQAMKKIYN